MKKAISNVKTKRYALEGCGLNPSGSKIFFIMNSPLKCNCMLILQWNLSILHVREVYCINRLVCIGGSCTPYSNKKLKKYLRSEFIPTDWLIAYKKFPALNNLLQSTTTFALWTISHNLHRTRCNIVRHYFWTIFWKKMGSTTTGPIKLVYL